MRITVIMSLLLGLSFSIHAASAAEKKGELAQKRKILDWETEHTRSKELNKKTCGFEIPADFNAKAFADAGFIEKGRDAGKMCAEAHWAVRSLCEDAVAKPLVQEKIKKISCKAGKAGELNFTVTSGEFTITAGPEAKNVSQKSKEYLNNNL